MTSSIVSLRRRQVVIAGLAAAAMPASLLAAQRMGGFESAVVGLTVASEDRLILSGRVIGGAGKPIAGARVTAWRDAAIATSDADGRFMLVANRVADDASAAIDIRVNGRRVPANDQVFVRRDEIGSWRGTLEVALT
jgi:protocatechuate 3,4-dioxygenase beta subunit